MNKYYYSYIVNDAGFVHARFDGLSESQKEVERQRMPLGYHFIDYNKRYEAGNPFPTFRQEVTVRNLCNIVILGE